MSLLMRYFRMCSFGSPQKRGFFHLNATKMQRISSFHSAFGYNTERIKEDVCRTPDATNLQRESYFLRDFSPIMQPKPFLDTGKKKPLTHY